MNQIHLRIKQREKGIDLTETYDKGKHKDATKNFDYTTIADRLDGQME